MVQRTTFSPATPIHLGIRLLNFYIMAYSVIENLTEQGDGNLVEETAFYEIDRNIVVAQAGAVEFGVLNIVFRSDEITVFAALDQGSNYLPKVALPCPPYYHTIMSGAGPGVFIDPNS